MSQGQPNEIYCEGIPIAYLDTTGELLMTDSKPKRYPELLICYATPKSFPKSFLLSLLGKEVKVSGLQSKRSAGVLNLTSIRKR